MHDQFDEKLSARIKDVFEDFEDDSADMGWQQLRKSFPADEKTKPVFIWWWQSAAAILLALGTWAYVSRPVEKIYLTGKAKIEEHEQLKSSVPATPAEFNDATSVREAEAGKEEQLANISAQTTLFSSVKAMHSSKHYWPKPKTRSFAANVVYAKTPDTSDLNTIKEEEERVIVATTDASADSSNNVIEQKDNISALEKVLVADMLQRRKTKGTSLASLVADEEVKTKTAPKQNRKVIIGISAGSYLNYAKGSEGSVNTGVGILSDIPLGKKLKLSTGIALAQNSLKFESKIPTAATADFNTTIASKAKDAQNDIILPGLVNQSFINPVSYSLNNYNASLLGLDVPINLKYSVFKKKNELYLSAGLSSNFYLEENYTYSYQYTAGMRSTTEQEDDKAGQSKFQNFDFARMLNFSFGFEQPLTRQTQLSFEPFVKYPLGGQGARDIRFGSVGMNLKLNLSKSTTKQ